MKTIDVSNGDIVIMKGQEHRGEAIVLWKGKNNQPLIAYFDELHKGNYRPTWDSYDDIKQVVANVRIGEYLSHLNSEVCKEWRDLQGVEEEQCIT